MISIQTSVSKGWLYAEGGFRFDGATTSTRSTAGHRIAQ